MAKKHFICPLLLTCMLTAARAGAQPNQAPPRIPAVPRDSLILLPVPPRTIDGTQVTFSNRSLAQASLDLAYYFHFDSVAFIRPLDTARNYMGGDIEMMGETASSMLAFISKGTQVKLSSKQHTLFVWCPTCDADPDKVQFFMH